MARDFDDRVAAQQRSSLAHYHEALQALGVKPMATAGFPACGGLQWLKVEHGASVMPGHRLNRAATEAAFAIKQDHRFH
jgi:hypothetical protein